MPNSTVAPGGINAATAAPIASSVAVAARPAGAGGTGGPSTTPRISPGIGGAS